MISFDSIIGAVSKSKQFQKIKAFGEMFTVGTLTADQLIKLLSMHDDFKDRVSPAVAEAMVAAIKSGASSPDDNLFVYATQGGLLRTLVSQFTGQPAQIQISSDPTVKKCPHCHELVYTESSVVEPVEQCPHCGELVFS